MVLPAGSFVARDEGHLKPAETIHPLPSQRAFLVQVHAEAEVAQGRLTGRVEHVMSGQATHFASSEQLLAFMTRVLTSLHAPPAEPEGRPSGASEV